MWPYLVRYPGPAGAARLAGAPRARAALAGRAARRDDYRAEFAACHPDVRPRYGRLGGFRARQHGRLSVAADGRGRSRLTRGRRALSARRRRSAGAPSRRPRADAAAWRARLAGSPAGSRCHRATSGRLVVCGLRPGDAGEADARRFCARSRPCGRASLALACGWSATPPRTTTCARDAERLGVADRVDDHRLCRPTSAFDRAIAAMRRLPVPALADQPRGVGAVARAVWPPASRP